MSGEALYDDEPVILPEWDDQGDDDAAWVAALEASRRKQFAELAEL